MKIKKKKKKFKKNNCNPKKKFNKNQFKILNNKTGKWMTKNGLKFNNV